MTKTTKPEPESSAPLVVSRRDVLSGAMAISISFALSSTGHVRKAVAANDVGETLAAGFRNPPQAFAPIDNWWWEAGQVNKEKMIWQLKELKDKGVGGTWFYVRWVYGESLSSIPQYWTDEWWDLTRFSVEEYQKLGLTHYFSNWTLTQFQQDLVRKEKKNNPALEGRELVIYRLDGDGVLELEAGDAILEAAAYRQQGDSLDYASRTLLTDSIRDNKLNWKAPGSGWILTVLAARPWDLDYVSKAVGERFTDAFLGEYQRRLPEHVGKTLQAFGADEMTLLNGDTLFSPSVLSKVQADRGYDLAPYLIGLFYDIGPKTDQIRCDYYDAMTALLEDNFYKAPGAWLEARGMKHSTLSQLGAGDPLEQTSELGDVFRYLRTFHEPGNEDPGRTKPGERRLLASKLSSSIAHLYERDRVVMCVHYASGWGMTQEENVAWTNESYAKGLNLYCRHGAYHTLMGGWYEWFPPMDHFYQPHWLYWRPFSEYVTRLSFVLSQGKHRADVALFYPISTIHAHWVAGRNASEGNLFNDPAQKQAFDAPAVRASQSLQDLAQAVYHDGIDFNFLDNASLERANVKGNVLEVAGVEFRSVVLPALTTIRSASIEKLRDYYEAGGTIVAFERLPTASAENGRGDPKLRAVVEAIFGSVSGAGVPALLNQTNARGGKAFFVPSDVNRVPPVISNAIVRDVAAAGKDVFHIHKRIGERDVYFLFNVRTEKRELPIRFRAQGNVEIWDSHTGERRPVYRVKRDGETSEVRLTMHPAEGVVVVFSPGALGPAVLEDNVSELVKIETQGKLALQGFDADGGPKVALLLHEGQTYVAQARVDAPPRKIALQGPFMFRLEPTMDNRWGDYRYPASNRSIGAEARRFRYCEEAEVSGTDQGWQRAEFDDSKWEEVTYSYGPYWWHLGPFQPGSEAKGLLEQARRGEINVEQVWNSSGQSVRWQRQDFSKKFGYLSKRGPPAEIGLDGLLGVPENFLVLDDPAPGNDVHYFFTSVHAPADGDYFMHVGAKRDRLFFSFPGLMPQQPLPSRVRMWVSGVEASLAISKENPDARAKVRLKKGSNAVLMEIVRPEEGPVAIYAALFQSEPPKEEPYVPLLRWFREPQRLVYDVTPTKAKRVGWYRFKAPPGTRAIQLETQGGGTQAWVDGQSVPIEGGRISLTAPKLAVSQVALRLEQDPGTYAGAVFPEPVSFECAEGQIPLGDWSESGLATYSGVGVYSKDFRLGRDHLKGKVFVDLGVAKSVAELLVNGKSAGVRMARPFRFDVTDRVREGPNTLEVKVANTLANHMSTYPTRWVLEGQTVSGLLGPVELVFHAPVNMIARKARA